MVEVGTTMTGMGVAKMAGAAVKGTLGALENGGAPLIRESATETYEQVTGAAVKEVLEDQTQR